MSTATTLSYVEMVDLLRRNRFRPLGIPVCGAAALDPALIHYAENDEQQLIETVLVLPTYGAATVSRMVCARDHTQPDWIVESLLFQWVAPKEEAVLWLLKDYGLLPEDEAGEQQL